jgi:hypothetical protein
MPILPPHPGLLKSSTILPQLKLRTTVSRAHWRGKIHFHIRALTNGADIALQ